MAHRISPLWIASAFSVIAAAAVMVSPSFVTGQISAPSLSHDDVGSIMGDVRRSTGAIPNDPQEFDAALEQFCQNIPNNQVEAQALLQQSVEEVLGSESNIRGRNVVLSGFFRPLVQQAMRNWDWIKTTIDRNCTRARVMREEGADPDRILVTFINEAEELVERIRVLGGTTGR